jgi:hypothetical protein
MESGTHIRMATLERNLLSWSLGNLVLVALTGLLLRGIPAFGFALPYKNLLHGHSHFAFGGWITPALTWMILHYFPMLKEDVAYRHWRNIIFTLMISAFGMLLSFPFQGYGAVSILFSTLSICGTFYLVYVLWAPLGRLSTISARFLRTGLVFLVLSSIGPFATGPIIASGNAGGILYYNCVYFYLHFQYNGWFTFAIFSFIYSRHEQVPVSRRPALVYVLMTTGAILTFFLSVLWSKPGYVYHFMGGAGALMQAIALVFFRKDISVQHKSHFVRGLLYFSMLMYALKTMIQLPGSVPVMADFAFLHRDVIIAYLHLFMLGFVTTYVFYTFLSKWEGVVQEMKIPVYLFLAGFMLSEILLVMQALSGTIHIYIPRFQHMIFSVSMLLPVSTMLIYRKFTTRARRSTLLYGA